eukprot:237122-Hanusia_phi.AAC.4
MTLASDERVAECTRRAGLAAGDEILFSGTGPRTLLASVADPASLEGLQVLLHCVGTGTAWIPCVLLMISRTFRNGDLPAAPHLVTHCDLICISIQMSLCTRQRNTKFAEHIYCETYCMAAAGGSYYQCDSVRRHDQDLQRRDDTRDRTLPGGAARPGARHWARHWGRKIFHISI